jgi:hypothetical protein
MWGGGFGGGGGVNFERDSGVTQRMGPEIPMYKPTMWS